MLAKKLEGAGKSAVPAYIEDVFSTYLYNGTGTGSSQTITNGIDLSGKGGLVWEKQRGTTGDHYLLDSARGSDKYLASNSTAAQASNSGVSFNSDGYTWAAGWSTTQIIASWTFRKQAKFFDVVTYTGDGNANRSISHNLGSTPGCIIVKATSTTSNWIVFHRSASGDLKLNTSGTATAKNGIVSASSTDFVVQVSASDYETNANNVTYVAYLFAHNAGGFGASGSDNVISCGSYTGTDAYQEINLGWEPQWVMVKRSSDEAGPWNILDTMRGLIIGDSNSCTVLEANTSTAEQADATRVTLGKNAATGFAVNGADVNANASGSTYIYIAIRRGPMKTPTDATKVFTPTVYTGTNVDNRLVDTTIAPDMVWMRERGSTTNQGMVVGDRLRGQPYLQTGSTGVEVNDADSFDQQIISTTQYGNAFSSMSGVWVGNDATSKLNVNTTSNTYIALAFKRAPGFFDIVCYAGTGSNTTVSHNLGVAPELMIIKRRGTINAWAVYANNDNTDYLVLNTDAATVDDNTYWNDTSPTSTAFSVGTNAAVNASSSNYVAYLFASCSGVSKVGTYTGNGSNQTINCGFTNGARLVLIKRVDNSGQFRIFDTARGIVAGNDPNLLLGSTATENIDIDPIDPDNSGFVVNQEAVANVNVNNATYIYLAIA